MHTYVKLYLGLMYCKMYCFGQEHIFTTLSCDVFLFQFPFKQIECMEEWEGSLFSKWVFVTVTTITLTYMYNSIDY